MIVHRREKPPQQTDAGAVAGAQTKVNNATRRRNLSPRLSCATGNPIDNCWRCDPNWSTRHQRLADCAIGFGKNAVGGKYDRIYTVTDPSHDDPVNPKPDTLRHAAIQPDPLWIIFKSDMVIWLKQELIINSHKTIDGRGASIHIAGSTCIAIHHASNIIVHGIHIHDCVKSADAVIRDSPSHAGWWEVSDGDGPATRSINNATRRRNLSPRLSCATGNPIDNCWRCDPNWSTRHQRLADCAIGFGKNAVGGKYDRIYTVTDPSHDDPVNPKPDTLRHAAIQPDPLWIIFKSDMVIWLKQELIINSHKTIDGRGASIHIAGSTCIAIHHASNIIVHGIHIHDCVKSADAVIRDSPSHAGWWEVSDGDGVAIFGGRNVWIDHCSLSNCNDGLIDAIHAAGLAGGHDGSRWLLWF
ncbi:probable pectate lyase 22 [Phtheirospermum japonicum]|uniref:Pectate lyase n=1 Tax=Phtheirospermum japonicum TaxID=374723 RepID=A0A830B9N0_9LAMI|nr:probable pectate lyase 22 [Phtheirospermum japonicum]